MRPRNADTCALWEMRSDYFCPFREVLKQPDVKLHILRHTL